MQQQSRPIARLRLMNPVLQLLDEAPATLLLCARLFQCMQLQKTEVSQWQKYPASGITTIVER